MVIDLWFNLFTWMPNSLMYLCVGAVSLFFLIAFLNVIVFILDLIPFL